MNHKSRAIFELNRFQSIAFLVIYGAITMVVRFYLEPFLGGNYLVSIGIGLVMLAIVFLLVKIGVLNFQKDEQKSDS